MSATIRKAMPARKRLPVRNQITKAIMAAGKINRRISAINIIMSTPMIRSKINSPMSNSPLGNCNPGMVRVDRT